MRMTMIALLCAAAVQPLAAATFTAAPHTQHKIDLDTAPGHYSLWEADDLTGLNAVRAHFRVRIAAKDPQWGPVFRFQVQRGDELAQVTLLGFAGKKPILLQLDQRLQAGEQPKSEMFATGTQIGEELDLEIDWTPDGEISFTIRSPQSLLLSAQGERHTTKLSGAPTKFSILGSTGEIEVQSLALGTTG